MKTPSTKHRCLRLWPSLLAAIALLASEGRGGTAVRSPDNSPRTAWLTPESIEMLYAMSAIYALDTNRFFPTNNLDTVLRLTGSSDSLIQKLADMELTRHFLLSMQDKSRSDYREKIEKSVPQIGITVASHVVQSVSSYFGNDDQPGLRDLTAGLDDVLRGVQASANEHLAITYAGLSMQSILKEQIRSIIHRDGRPATIASPSVQVVLDELAAPHGFVDVVNRSAETWHHCLFFTHAEINRAQIGSSLAMEGLAGVLMSELGFSARTIGTTMTSALLRAQIAGLDQGLIIYVPEVRPGQRVRIRFCGPKNLLTVLRADISLWCDELAVDGFPVPALREMQQHTVALYEAQREQAIQEMQAQRQQQQRQWQNNRYRRW